jgi:hypothetical protein
LLGRHSCRVVYQGSSSEKTRGSMLERGNK